MKEGWGTLGDEQLTWLEQNLAGKSSSTPIIVFAHIPLWAIYPQWGWTTGDSERALTAMKRFGSVTILNGHIHQTMQKVEGNMTFHTAMSTAFPQPKPGAAPGPRSDESAGRSIAFDARAHQRPVCGGQDTLAIVDATLMSVQPATSGLPRL